MSLIGECVCVNVHLNIHAVFMVVVLLPLSEYADCKRTLSQLGHFFVFFSQRTGGANLSCRFGFLVADGASS
jgi:hypothetical protein